MKAYFLTSKQKPQMKTNTTKTYRERYESIIAYYQTNIPDKSVYCEIHHIIPQSLGGSNDSSNLVRLPGNVHFKVHCLLPFVYKEEHNDEGFRKMLYAMSCFLNSKEKLSKISISLNELAMEYETYRKLNRGENHQNHGKHWKLSEETRRKISLNNVSRRPEIRERKREKCSKQNMGRIWCHDPITNKNKFCYPDEKPENYILGMIHKSGLINSIKGKHAYHLPSGKIKYFSDNEKIPSGWLPGTGNHNKRR